MRGGLGKPAKGLSTTALGRGPGRFHLVVSKETSCCWGLSSTHLEPRTKSETVVAARWMRFLRSLADASSVRSRLAALIVCIDVGNSESQVRL
jgi:hypothetical protein